MTDVHVIEKREDGVVIELESLFEPHTRPRKFIPAAKMTDAEKQRFGFLDTIAKGLDLASSVLRTVKKTKKLRRL